MRFFGILFILAFATIGFTQSTTDIDNYDAISNHADLALLENELQDVQVVGLGESTHGTREFNLMYLKMFQYLVEVHGFNTLFLEDEYIPSARLDAFVKCMADCDPISAEVLTHWPWQTHEMDDLIAWIKDYNTANQSTPISIVGVDVQDAKGICEGLNTLLQAYNIKPVDLPTVEAATKETQQDQNNLRYSSEANIAYYRSQSARIDQKDKANYVQLLEYLKWNRLMSANPKSGHLRDLAMGRMLLSHLDQSPGTRGMLIAHNGHLFKFNEGKKNELKSAVLLGGVLDEALGDQYYFIMQDFDSGCFNAYYKTNSGNKNSINSYELGEVCTGESADKSVGAVLRNKEMNMTYISSRDLWQMLGTKYIKYHHIEALFYKDAKAHKHFFYAEKDHFDACIFHQRSTPTTLIKHHKSE